MTGDNGLQHTPSFDFPMPDGCSPDRASLPFEPLRTPGLDSHNESFHTQPDLQPSHVAEVSAVTMALPVKTRKRKAPTLKEKDWEPYKIRVLQLHVNQDKPLTEVKALMEESGFQADYANKLTTPPPRLQG